MKITMFAAALMLGGAAVAQTTTETQGTAGQSMQTQPMQTPPAPMDQSSQPMPSTQPAPDTTMSDPNAQAPAGTMAPPAQPMMDSSNMATQGMAQPMSSMATTGAYPRCSRTVVDRCTQSGSARRR